MCVTKVWLIYVFSNKHGGQVLMTFIFAYKLLPLLNSLQGELTILQEKNAECVR